MIPAPHPAATPSRPSHSFFIVVDLRSYPVRLVIIKHSIAYIWSFEFRAAPNTNSKVFVLHVVHAGKDVQRVLHVLTAAIFLLLDNHWVHTVKKQFVTRVSETTLHRQTKWKAAHFFHLLDYITDNCVSGHSWAAQRGREGWGAGGGGGGDSVE